MKTIATVSLNSILKHDPCQSGLEAFKKHFGHLSPDTSVNLLDCLESNPVPDVIWALRAVEQDISALLPLIAADFAESVLYLFEEKFPNDDRPRKAIEAARGRGEDSSNASHAAHAAYAAADAAYAAADASHAAHAAHASYAAADAAHAAANAAAYAAADAAYAAADASHAAHASYASYAAADAAHAAAHAAEKGEETKQVEILKRYFKS